MPIFHRPKVPEALSPSELDVPAKESKHAVVGESQISVSGSDSDAISMDAQVGVQKMEATTKAWTRSSLITAYAMYGHDLQ